MEQGIIHKCDLGYKYDQYFKPTEPCPKPKTYEEYIECKQSNGLSEGDKKHLDSFIRRMNNDLFLKYK